MSAKLGEILVRENLITPQQLREALEYQRSNGGRLGSNLVTLGIISDDVITAVLSRKYGVPSVNLELFQIDEPTINLISQEAAVKYSILPVSKVGATLTLAMADPTNVFAMDDIKFMTGLNIEPVISSEASILGAISKYYATSKAIELAEFAVDGSFRKGGVKTAKNGNGAVVSERISESDLKVSLDGFQFGAVDSEELEVLADNDEIDLAELARASEDAPVVRLVNVLLVDSLRRGASDIHVEPYEKDFRIRFRIDGLLYDVMHPPMKMRDPLISRLKIMSKLDISEKRLPQDGRIKIKVKIDTRARELDFRVSTLPTLFGEKVVLRLLDKDKLMLDMTKLGFEPQSLEIFQRNISKPYGMSNIMIRAIVLSLVLVIGLATIVPIATEYAEAGSQRKGKKKRYQKRNKSKKRSSVRRKKSAKRYSKRWWAAYRARQKKRQAVNRRKRNLRLRQIRLAKQSGNAEAKTSASSDAPKSRQKKTAVLPTGEKAPASWTNAGSSKSEARFNVADGNGSASISIVGPAVGEDSDRPRNGAIGGVSVTSLRRTVIDKMINENGCIRKNLSRSIRRCRDRQTPMN